MIAAIAKNTKDTKIGFLLGSSDVINHGSAIVSMDVTVTGAFTDGTGFQFWFESIHKRIKKRF